MNFREQTKEILRDNKWIIAAAIILLAWKIFLIQTMWHGRLIPPEPDDSYIYVTHIESVKKCPSLFFCEKPIYSMSGYAGYSHLIYRLFFGYLAIIFNVSSETMFYWSFYIGAILLIPILWIFLKSLNFDKNLIAFSFLFAMLSHGGSGMHSFAWIVPSYFALLFILLIYSFIIGDFKKWKFWLVILIPLAIYTHTIVIYLIFIPVLYAIMLSVLSKKIERELFKKIGLSLLVAFLVYAPLSFYLASKNNFSKGNPYGIETFLSESIKNSKKGFKEVINANKPSSKTTDNIESGKKVTNWPGMFPGYQQIKYNYLQLVVFNPFGFLALVLFTSILLYYRKFQIISIFFSSLLFLIISSINYFGFRSLLFVWPITFIFYASGFWYLFKFLQEDKAKRISNFIKFIAGSAMIILFIVGTLFSYFYHDFDNKDNNFFINKRFVSYLENNVSQEEKVIYSNHLLRYVQWIYGTKKIEFTNNVNSAKYLVYIRIDNSGEIYEKSRLNAFIEYFYSPLGIKREKNKVSQVKTEDISRTEKRIIEENFVLEEEFGRVKIYKNLEK